MQKTHYSTFSQTSYNSETNAIGSTASLKGKLQTLELLMNEVGDLVEMQRNEFQLLKNLKEELEAQLKAKTEDMQKSLWNELVLLDNDLKREVSHQLAENKRIQQQLTHLKGEKTNLGQQLIGVQKRIIALESQVGNHEQN